MDYKETASMFKAFCDENRLKIMELLLEGEICACNILEELSIAQSTLSHHMKILITSGIVIGRKEGKWVHYSLNEEKLKDAINVLDMMKVKEGSNKKEACGCKESI